MGADAIPEPATKLANQSSSTLWHLGLWFIALAAAAGLVAIAFTTPMLPLLAAIPLADLVLAGVVSMAVSIFCYQTASNWLQEDVGRRQRVPRRWAIGLAGRFACAWMPLASLGLLAVVPLSILPFAWPGLMAFALLLPVVFMALQLIVVQPICNRIAVSPNVGDRLRRWALRLGAHTQFPQHEGRVLWTPFKRAAQAGHLRTIRQLSAWGIPDENSRFSEIEDGFKLGVQHGHIHVAGVLWPQIKARTPGMLQSLLRELSNAKLVNLDMIQWLLGQGASPVVERGGDWDNTSVKCAIKHGNADLVGVFKEGGRALDPCMLTRTALHFKKMEMAFEYFKTIPEADQPTVARDAVWASHAGIVGALLDANQIDAATKVSLCVSALGKKERFASATLLFNDGVSVDAKIGQNDGNPDHTLLMHCVAYNMVDAAEFLIDRGADCTVVEEKTGDTLLHLYIKRGHTGHEIPTLLLRKMDLNVENKDGKTAYALADDKQDINMRNLIAGYQAQSASAAAAPPAVNEAAAITLTLA